jgi:hypothetical protein
MELALNAINYSSENIISNHPYDVASDNGPEAASGTADALTG